MTLTVKSRLCGEFVPKLEFETDGYSVALKNRDGELDGILSLLPVEPPGISVNELSLETGLNRAWLYEALGRLEAQGRITIQEGKRSRFHPSLVWRKVVA
jgi:hypothetical protein